MLIYVTLSIGQYSETLTQYVEDKGGIDMQRVKEVEGRMSAYIDEVVSRHNARIYDENPPEFKLS